jgi:hypothetical protein
MSIAPANSPPVWRPGSTLTRVDFVLIAASLFVFLFNAATHHAHGWSQNTAAPISANLPKQTSSASNELSLTKARISFGITINM